MIKKIKTAVLTSLFCVAPLISSCGTEEPVSTISYYEIDESVSLKRIKFQAILGIGETVTVEELLEFYNAPRTPYKDVPDGNMRDLLKSMKRGVKGKDVSHYFWDFFHQEEQINLTPEKFEEYLSSIQGKNFIKKFDSFIKTDDDDETPEIIYNSVMESYNCVEEICNIKLIDIVIGLKGTEKITAYVMKIKNDQDFYDNMIKHLKDESEAYEPFDPFKL